MSARLATSAFIVALTRLGDGQMAGIDLSGCSIGRKGVGQSAVVIVDLAVRKRDESARGRVLAAPSRRYPLGGTATAAFCLASTVRDALPGVPCPPLRADPDRHGTSTILQDRHPNNSRRQRAVAVIRSRKSSSTSRQRT